MLIRFKWVLLAALLMAAEGSKAKETVDYHAISVNAKVLGLEAKRVVRGEVVRLGPTSSGTVCLTGWSLPKVSAKEIARIAKETNYGTFKVVRKGSRVEFKTDDLHPGVYLVSLVKGKEVKAVQEIVIAYPDDYVFNLKDPLLHGIKNAWNGSPKSKLYDKHYTVVSVESQVDWTDLQPERERFDFSELDELMAWSAYVQKPAIFKFNMPAPEWIFDYVAHVGGKSPRKNGQGGGISRREAKAPQFWAPAYKQIYQEMIAALAKHVAESPHRKWFLGLRVQPNAFNEEAWHYNFNGREMQMAGILPDRSTWIPPRNGDPIYPPLLEADDFKEGKKYFRYVIDFYQEIFQPLGIYCFLRPYLEFDQDLNIDLSTFYANPYSVCMGTDAVASRTKPVSDRAAVFKKYTRDMKKGAFHEDTYCSFKADDWNARHGREMNYRVSPRSPEKEIYWRQFFKLYEGVTMSAFGSIELMRLDNPAYRAAVDLFMEYVGGEMDVTKAEHAWMVFAGYSDGGGKTIKMRNVGYWLSEDDPSKSEIVIDAADDYRAFMLGAIKEKETTLSISPEFRQSHDGKTARISVEWLAKVGDAWELYADGKRLGVARGTQDGFQTSVFDLSAVPEQITLRKGAGNPNYHRVDVSLN